MRVASGRVAPAFWNTVANAGITITLITAMAATMALTTKPG